MRRAGNRECMAQYGFRNITKHNPHLYTEKENIRRPFIAEKDAPMSLGYTRVDLHISGFSSLQNAGD